MKPEIKRILEQTGWDELYERYIPNLAAPNARGERRALSPFPDTIDRNPSFSVNSQTGKWNCFKTERGGDYITFRAIMDAEEFDPHTGYAIIDYAKTEREIAKEIGLTKPIDPKWVDECAAILYHDPLVQQQLQMFKPWNRDLLYQMRIGYSQQHNRFVIPIYDRYGSIVNCRMYRPGSDPKFIWLESNAGGNFLFPRTAWNEKSLILVEGEPDAISLRSYGYPAVSGTLGKGQPVPDGEWWRDKVVFVLMDVDKAGQEAQAEAVRRMVHLATEVRVVTLPEWPGRPAKADISDYILYLRTCGYELDQVQREISNLLINSTGIEKLSVVLDQEGLAVAFRDALSSENLNRRVKFVARVSAKSSRKFILPIQYTLTCPAEGHAYCKRCPMHITYHGNGRFTHDPRTKDTFRLIQVSDKSQIDAMKEANGIVKTCIEPKASIDIGIDVEAVIINASATLEAIDTNDDVNSDRSRREAFVIVPPGEFIEENREYVFEGFIYPHPATQQSVFLIDRFTPTVSVYESFQLDDDLVSELRQYQVKPGESVIDKMKDVASDLSENKTFIYGREDLHLVYRTVFHSVISFMFGGRKIERGWIECLVIGDTRCGKSEAYKQLSEYYGIGILIDCKMQTVPGVLGTVVQSTSGEYYVVAGLLPQQDGRIVCFDEFVVPKWAGQSIIEVLSSTRSEGIVRISKAASAEFKARVRSIWLANPGAGKLMSQSSSSGVELISRIITQPEDIARFDIALAVTQNDVPHSVINRITKRAEGQTSKYSMESARKLLSWTYSRKPHQIHFTSEAESLILEYAERMCLEYDSKIPLVEISDQRNRIAKIAVSIAAQVFSTDETCEKIVVNDTHVHAARHLFSICYDKAAMGYRVFSDRKSKEDTLENVTAIDHLFREAIKPYGLRLAEELLRLDEITEKTFGTIIPIENFFARSFLQQLYVNRGIQLIQRGKREAYEKTPALTAWLKQFVNDQTIECSNLPSMV